MFVTRKLAAAAATGVLSLAVTGAAAFAAFQPDATPTLTSDRDTGAIAAQVDREGARDKVKDVLDGLVQKGVITQDQEDKIVAAFKAARGDGDHDGDGRGLKLAIGDLFKISADYLGMSRADLEAKLHTGMSLGEVASSISGHSREGLITFDVAKASEQVDKLVADGKLTAERAAEIKSRLTEHVTKLVDHKSHGKSADAKGHQKAAPKK